MKSTVRFYRLNCILSFYFSGLTCRKTMAFLFLFLWKPPVGFLVSCCMYHVIEDKPKSRPTSTSVWLTVLRRFGLIFVHLKPIGLEWRTRLCWWIRWNRMWLVMLHFKIIQNCDFSSSGLDVQYHHSCSREHGWLRGRNALMEWLVKLLLWLTDAELVVPVSYCADGFDENKCTGDFSFRGCYPAVNATCNPNYISCYME